MINFFRIKRKDLANKKKLAKYIRYAIGEIILVVIGILIALALNNWNNIRLKNKLAKALINRLIEEIKINKEHLDYQVHKVNALRDETQTLLTLFGKDTIAVDIKLMDSLLYGLISTPIYISNSSTLDEALSTGQVSILSSSKLREILYEIPQKKSQLKNYEEDMIRDNENNLIPYLYNEISLRQMDENFSEELKSIASKNITKTDNRRVLNSRKFENLVDNKFFLLETLQMGLSDLNSVFNKSLVILKNELNK